MTRIGIVAGEQSGDARAGALMREMLKLKPDIEFLGVGGQRMAALAGPDIEDWIAEAAVVGLWDVLRHYPYFRRKFAELRRRLLDARPAAVIFIDYPGFNLRLAAALRPHLPATRFVYYISPQVWAWNRRRIPKMARILDRMICIFPFEQPLYQQTGLDTVFVGHPFAEEMAESHEPARDPLLLGLFPGSRRREVRLIFPVMIETVRRIVQSRPDIRIQAAAADAAAARWMREQAAAAKIECGIGAGTARDLMRVAAAGLVCSGTATLEAAFCGLPYALVYRVPWLTYEIGRRVIRVPYLGIVNILADRPVVREFVQADCNPVALADEALRLLNNSDTRERLASELAQITAQLGGPGASARAAAAVLQTLGTSPMERVGEQHRAQ